MLRFLSYDIVFQEVPGEVSLAINISNCPHRCKGCHSPHLQEDKGECLDRKALGTLLASYGEALTCICFMGGDADPKSVESLALFVRESTQGRLKTAWYSGRAQFPHDCSPESFDYVKIGPYIEALGGLDAPTSNQRFYQVKEGRLVDRTELFHSKFSTNTYSPSLPNRSQEALRPALT